MIQLPPHTKENRVVLSPTRVELGQRCLRKHTLADTLSYRQNGTEVSGALTFGERMHAAAALLWRGEGSDVGTEYLRSCGWEGTGSKHTLGLALSCWGAYAHTARLMPFVGPGEVWEPLAIEKRVVLPVSASLSLSFQMDRLVTDGTRLALVDLKTAARCDVRWSKQWQRSLQMKLYSCAVEREYGRELDWLIIEGLAKDNATVSYLPLQTFTKEQRDEAWRAFEWVADHDLQLLDACTYPEGTVNADRLLLRALTETPFSPAECFTYNSECEYLPLCDAQPSERLGLLRDGYVYVEPEWV